MIMNLKIVVITGVSTGIGRELCIKLSHAGYRVIGTVRDQLQGEKLKREIQGHFDYVVLDLLDQHAVTNFGQKIKEKTGENGIFCLINNAGVAMGGPMMLLPYEELHQQMKINFYSVFSITNALLPQMGAGFNTPFKPGMIINISSVSGIFNSPFLGPYCISKHALASMSDIYRRELAVFGIKLVLIQPGPIRTPIWGKSVPKQNPYLNTDFEAVYDALTQEIETSEKNALPVERISELVLRVMKKKNPATRYLVTKNNLMMILVSHCMPDKWMDRIFYKKFKKVLR